MIRNCKWQNHTVTKWFISWWYVNSTYRYYAKLAELLNLSFEGSKLLLFTLKENNFQLFFLGQTKHIVKPRHCYTYALLSRRHNIILFISISHTSLKSHNQTWMGIRSNLFPIWHIYLQIWMKACFLNRFLSMVTNYMACHTAVESYTYHSKNLRH